MPAHPANLSETDIRQVKRMRARKEPQHKPKMLPPANRDGFALIEQSLTKVSALNEAARCLQCSTFCDKCVEVCPNRANLTFYVTPMNLALPLLSCEDGKLKAAGEERFMVEQARQIIHIADFCNECGNCDTFCVHHGKPYAEKPRLFLGKDEFELQDDNAFYIDGDTIRQRKRGKESQLSVGNGTVTFTNPQVRISLSPALNIHEMALRQEFEGILSLKPAAEMALILNGIRTSAPFLATRLPMGRAQ
jgi:putative selenate reductase